MSERQRTVLLEHTFIGGDLERRIRSAAADGAAVVIALDLDALDELLGHVAAAANHSEDLSVAEHLRRVFERLSRIEAAHADADEPRFAAATEGAAPPRYTAKQGQYLSFIFYYTKIHRLPPAESDLRGYFKVSAPTVHQMVVTLEARGLLERVAGKPRSIRLLVSRADLPELE
jgi:repressor LexA